jgi:hypothetical protein
VPVVDIDELFDTDTEGDNVILVFGVLDGAGLIEYEQVSELYTVMLVCADGVFVINFESDCEFDAVIVFE